MRCNSPFLNICIYFFNIHVLSFAYLLGQKKRKCNKGVSQSFKGNFSIFKWVGSFNFNTGNQMSDFKLPQKVIILHFNGGSQYIYFKFCEIMGKYLPSSTIFLDEPTLDQRVSYIHERHSFTRHYA